MFKKLLKVIAVLVILIAVGIGSVFYFTSDMVDVSDEFFAALRDDDLDHAYRQLSVSFQQSTGRQDLAAFVERNALNDFSEANWGSRSIEGSGRGKVSGTITTTGGGTIPLTIEFVKENGAWKIYSIYQPGAGLAAAEAGAEIPDEQQLVDLVRESDQAFANAINARSMTGFHDHISRLWRDQFSVADLDQAYNAFYEAGVDLTVLATLTPQFASTPALDAQGVLIVAGTYPTRPSQYHFEHKYVYEGLGWKLLGYSANIK